METVILFFTINELKKRKRKRNKGIKSVRTNEGGEKNMKK